jgi:hypothetical protein
LFDVLAGVIEDDLTQLAVAEERDEGAVLVADGGDGFLVGEADVVERLDLLAVDLEEDVLLVETGTGGIAGIADAEDEDALGAVEVEVRIVELIDRLDREVPARAIEFLALDAALGAGRDLDLNEVRPGASDWSRVGLPLGRRPRRRLIGGDVLLGQADDGLVVDA